MTKEELLKEIFNGKTIESAIIRDKDVVRIVFMDFSWVEIYADTFDYEDPKLTFTNGSELQYNEDPDVLTIYPAYMPEDHEED